MGNSLTQDQMRGYLTRSISSRIDKTRPTELNLNKLHGLLAEVDFRKHLSSLGFDDRVSPGGWIARSTGSNTFAHNTVVFFPETVLENKEYPTDRPLPEPPRKLHTICATFHQIGIASYFCTPLLSSSRPESLRWKAVQLGIPSDPDYIDFPDQILGFTDRKRKYNYLRYNTDVSAVPKHAVEEEFSKENIRVAFQDRYLAEVSDVDGILWGERLTYPVEIKEKTPATDSKVGEYFGLDVGPFVKLAFYAAKRENLHSLFVVREIKDIETRELVNWWAITFDRLAQFASWIPQPGGSNMLGGRSSTVKIPKAEFSTLNKAFLDVL